MGGRRGRPRRCCRFTFAAPVASCSPGDNSGLCLDFNFRPFWYFVIAMVWLVGGVAIWLVSLHHLPRRRQRPAAQPAVANLTGQPANRRVVLLAALLVPLVSVVAVCGGDRGDDRTTLSPFVGICESNGRLVVRGQERESWRTLDIGRTERAWEQINIGCCHTLVLLRFRISHRRGTAHAATARATVTRVEIVDRQWFTKKALSAPHVGETGTIRVRDLVVYEGLTGVYYCSRRNVAAAAVRSLTGRAILPSGQVRPKVFS
jgi:hypothetical protein